MKRILIFSLTYHPFVGGAEVALKEIMDRIDQSAYEFDMVTLRFDSRLPEVERIGNVTVYRIGATSDNPKISDRDLPPILKRAKILFPFTSFWKARALHRTHPYDMTLAMMANYAGFGALFFKYAYPRVPYVLELQDGNSLVQLRERQSILRFIWPLYTRIYTKADMIKAISTFIEKLTREIGYRGPVAVIPNAVDTARFAAPIDSSRLWELKNTFDKQHGDTFLITASRLVTKNATDDIIRALALLPPQVKLLVAGEGEDRAMLEALVRELHLEGRVMFAGYVGHEDLPAYLKICDIFVRPSIIEGFGNSFVEAFAAGIPVIATPVGGITDFLFDPWKDPEYPSTGIFCNVRDPHSIADAVQKYLADPTLTATIVKNARALAIEKYDWNIIAADMQREVFDELTQK